MIIKNKLNFVSLNLHKFKMKMMISLKISMFMILTIEILMKILKILLKKKLIKMEYYQEIKLM